MLHQFDKKLDVWQDLQTWAIGAKNLINISNYCFLIFKVNSIVLPSFKMISHEWSYHRIGKIETIQVNVSPKFIKVDTISANSHNIWSKLGFKSHQHRKVEKGNRTSDPCIRILARCHRSPDCSTHIVIVYRPVGRLL